MYGRLMLTCLGKIDGVHVDPLIWHIDPDPSWVYLCGFVFFFLQKVVEDDHEPIDNWGQLSPL